MKNILRIIIEVLFLSVFILLIIMGNLQKWLPVFLGGVVLSLIFSRFYCGWICPMGTMFRPINWIYNKLHIKRFTTPLFFKKKAVRYIFLILMLASMVLSMKFKIHVNLLLYVTVLSVIVTLFFEESFWHNHICPYGTILNLSSRPAPLSVKIEEEKCSACGKCQKVCPSEAIKTLENKKRIIIKKTCLTCFKCQEVCPTEAITYRK
jgi:ferredoxin-type protein NapH